MNKTFLRHTKSLSKAGGELTQKSTLEMENDNKLKDYALNLISSFGSQWNVHQSLFLKRQTLSRLIYQYELYRKIVDVPGVICEFGVQWGATLSILIGLRGILEPYNISRQVVGFDTFNGFPSVTVQDGGFGKSGDYSTKDGYESVLEKILALQETFSPLSHVKKFDLIKGDASITFKKWLQDNPAGIIAMAIFDMDIYQPTRDVLKLIVPRLTRGSLLVFDELNCRHWPGETLALMETIGLNKLALRRHPHQPYCAWAVFE